MLEYTGNLGHERQLTAYQLGSKSSNDDKDESSHASNMDTDASAMNESNNDTTTALDTTPKEEITLLDTLTVERERGITVKASAASMLYHYPPAINSKTNPNGWILLNMVDTPGHADFGMEVSKSLDSVEGAVLLFDSAQGVQAQTLSVYDKAKMVGGLREGEKKRRRELIDASEGNGAINTTESEESNEDEDNGAIKGIQILPALTKIDMPSSRPLEVALAVSDLMGFDPDTILKVRRGSASI